MYYLRIYSSEKDGSIMLPFNNDLESLITYVVDQHERIIRYLESNNKKYEKIAFIWDKDRYDETLEVSIRNFDFGILRHHEPRLAIFGYLLMPELHKVAVRGLHIDHIAAVLVLRAVNPDGLPQPPRLVPERRGAFGLLKDLRGNASQIGINLRPDARPDVFDGDVHHDVIAHSSPPGTSAPVPGPGCPATGQRC